MNEYSQVSDIEELKAMKPKSTGIADWHWRMGELWEVRMLAEGGRGQLPALFHYKKAEEYYRTMAEHVMDLALADRFRAQAQIIANDQLRVRRK